MDYFFEHIAKTLKAWKLDIYEDKKNYDIYVYIHNTSEELSALGALSVYSTRLISIDHKETVFLVENHTAVILMNM